MKKGQSLIEVLVGVAIGAIFIIGASTIIAPSLQIQKKTSQTQTQTALGDELAGNVKSWAKGNWNSLVILPTGTANRYYLTTSTSPFTTATGTESIVVSGDIVRRYFYLGDVYRDSSGNVTTTVSGSSYDPSTRMLTIIANLSSSVFVPSTTITTYLTRSLSNVMNQTNWAGGAGQSGVVKVVNSQFSTSSNVDVSGGVIVLTSSGSQSCTQ